EPQRVRRGFPPSGLLEHSLMIRHLSQAFAGFADEAGRSARARSAAWCPAPRCGPGSDELPHRGVGVEALDLAVEPPALPSLVDDDLVAPATPELERDARERDRPREVGRAARLVLLPVGLRWAADLQSREPLERSPAAHAQH